MAQKVKYLPQRHQDLSLKPWLSMVLCTVIPVVEEGLRRISKTYCQLIFTKPVSFRVSVSERALFKNKGKNH